MTHHDVFNGDADGLCALQQLRLAQPRAARLVTGVKRDIALLQRVDAAAGDSVTVLDISLDRNRAALQSLLQRGVAIEYFDHHHAGEVPHHPLLHAVLDPSPATCTSALVDRHLDGSHRAWAAAGAFGDNLPELGVSFARSVGLGEPETELLRRLGEAINYNAYGDGEADLLIAPAQLALRLRPHADPLVFAREEPIARALMDSEAQDLALGLAVAPAQELPGASVLVLPDAAWARRVQGSLANALSRRAPQRAHAVLRPCAGEAYVVSVRAPRAQPRGADALCLAFAGGGGRAAAAGIDGLPRAQVDRFVQALAGAFPGPH
jgi:hypothetical protein